MRNGRRLTVDAVLEGCLSSAEQNAHTLIRRGRGGSLQFAGGGGGYWGLQPDGMSHRGLLEHLLQTTSKHTGCRTAWGLPGVDHVQTDGPQGP